MLLIFQMGKLENLHIHHLQLYAFGSVGQYALQRLLAHFSVQSNFSVSNDPNIALMDIFKTKSNEVKNINSITSNPKNLELIYEDFPNGILRHRTDISSFDTTLLADVLFGISVFSTSNPSFRRGRSCKKNGNHTYTECCDSCDHLCSICNRKSCTGHKCCVTGRTCAHKCKKCNVSYHECRDNRYICCLSCALCLNCLLGAYGLKNWYELIEKWVKSLVTGICPEQEIRMAVSVVLTFRNLTMHLSSSECELMDNGCFQNDKLPSTCKYWNEIRDIVLHSTECILKYLRKNDLMFTLNEFKKHSEYLRCVAFATNKAELLSIYGSSSAKYFSSEQLIELREELDGLKEDFASTKENVVWMRESLEKRTLFVEARIVFPEPLQDFTLNCKQAGTIQQAFIAAVEQYFEEKQSDSTFTVFMHGFKAATMSQVEIKVVPLEFNIKSSNKFFPWKDFEKFDLEKSKLLWDFIQSEIVNALPGTTVGLSYWRLGSIIVHAVIRKISSKSWTEEELTNIDLMLPNLTNTIQNTLGGVQCTCTRSKVVFQQENTLDFHFDIQSNDSYFTELFNNMHSEFFQLYLQYFINGMWRENLSLGAPTSKTIIHIIPYRGKKSRGKITKFFGEVTKIFPDQIFPRLFCTQPKLFPKTFRPDFFYPNQNFSPTFFSSNAKSYFPLTYFHNIFFSIAS